MSEHVHDENCDHDHDHEDMVFIVEDENGNEIEMVMVYQFANDGKDYAVLLDRNDPEADGIIFRIEEEEEGYALVGIEDDAEWDKAVAAYNKLAQQEGQP